MRAAVLEAPTIKKSPHPAADLIKSRPAAFARLHEYDWIIFTSVNGVTQTKTKLTDFHLDARAFGKAKIATIGDATAKAVRDHLCSERRSLPGKFRG